MPEQMIRTHVLLPRQLVESVDQLVGQRKRSAFVARAIEDKLAHERLGRALEMAQGYLDNDAHPEWETPEKTSAWVRELRREADKSTARKIGEID